MSLGKVFDLRRDVFLELGVKSEALHRLRNYVDILWAANEELNLISRKMTFDDLIDNHLIDCLLPLSKFPETVTEAADLGAGGGLPGVVFAICFPQVRYHLFEKSPRKQEFLNQCKVIAPNLVIRGEIPKDLGGIQLVTARAFKPIDVILEISRDYFLRKGKYFLLKGRLEKIDEELGDARKKFKDVRAQILPLQSPVLEVERNLVLIN